MEYATKHREAKPRFVKTEIGTRETLLSSTPLMTETCYGWLGKITDHRKWEKYFYCE